MLRGTFDSLGFSARGSRFLSSAVPDRLSAVPDRQSPRETRASDEQPSAYKPIPPCHSLFSQRGPSSPFSCARPLLFRATVSTNCSVLNDMCYPRAANATLAIKKTVTINGQCRVSLATRVSHLIAWPMDFYFWGEWWKWFWRV